jgi:DNA invertase Pin-like site-specific DNA recombinase
MGFKKQTAIYLRTSTLKQEKGHEAQLTALKKWCDQNNISNYFVYEDKGVSGAKVSRPGLDKLMKDARHGKIDSVIVYSFSRFARSTRHLLSALAEFNSLGVRFNSISESIDTNSALGRAVFVIVSAISELERDLISERVKCGLENAKRKGRVGGRKKVVNTQMIYELAATQKYSQTKIASIVGCHRSTVCRELKKLHRLK